MCCVSHYCSVHVGVARPDSEFSLTSLAPSHLATDEIKGEISANVTNYKNTTFRYKRKMQLIDQ